jgi:hypothetical protein
MSHIKGGGRAQFSEEVEEALTSVLLALREPHIKITSEHDRKREHRRFLRKLKDRQERQALTRKVNPGQSNKASDSTTLAQVMALSQQGAKPVEHRKVRMELVEAVFGSSKECKKGGTKSSSNPSVCFQDGAKKTLVFAASTSVENVMKEAHTKLRMKKKPVRCFVVQDNIAVDLVGDLRGIKDGDKVYVTYHQEQAKRAAVPEEENQLHWGSPDNYEFDPLAAVKEAYRRNKRRQRSPRQTSRIIPLKHPDFTSYREQLIALPCERANLPAAPCRDIILDALSTKRVMIVCGETGCGTITTTSMLAS